MSPDPQPASIRRYTRLRELGRGSGSVVDLVYDDVGQRELACKRWPRPSAETRFRIRQQYRRDLTVQHPNLVKLYNLFSDGEATCMTMEVVHGRSVRDMRGTLGLDRALDLLAQLADALVTLHAAGIVHRDVKPTKLLVEPAGRAVLLDGGFAWPRESSFEPLDEHALTYTIPYLAPECLRGALPSVEADWYGFGVLASELFAGQVPFAGSFESVLRAKDMPPLTLRERVPELPEALDDLIYELLQREPKVRPSAGTIQAVLGELAQFASAHAPALEIAKLEQSPNISALPDLASELEQLTAPDRVLPRQVPLESDFYPRQPQQPELSDEWDEDTAEMPLPALEPHALPALDPIALLGFAVVPQPSAALWPSLWLEAAGETLPGADDRPLESLAAPIVPQPSAAFWFALSEPGADLDMDPSELEPEPSVSPEPTARLEPAPQPEAHTLDEPELAPEDLDPSFAAQLSVIDSSFALDFEPITSQRAIEALEPHPQLELAANAPIEPASALETEPPLPRAEPSALDSRENADDDDDVAAAARLESDVAPRPDVSVRLLEGLSDLEAVTSYVGNVTVSNSEIANSQSDVEQVPLLDLPQLSAASVLSPAVEPEGPLAERRAELDKLIGLLTDPTGTQLVCLRGPAGSGKSHLLQQFAAEARSHAGWSVFDGQCASGDEPLHAAFQRMMPQLIDQLERVDSPALPNLSGTAALCCMFPALGRLRRSQPMAASPETQRRFLDALTEFRNLWVRLARASRILMLIDDCQLLDRDSLRLLQALLGREPCPNLTVVLCYRTESAEEPLISWLERLENERAVAQLSIALPAPKAFEHNARARAANDAGSNDGTRPTLPPAPPSPMFSSNRRNALRLSHHAARPIAAANDSNAPAGARLSRAAKHASAGLSLERAAELYSAALESTRQSFDERSREQSSVVDLESAKPANDIAPPSADAQAAASLDAASAAHETAPPPRSEAWPDNRAAKLMAESAVADTQAGRLAEAASSYLVLARSSQDRSAAHHFELEAAAALLRAGNMLEGRAALESVLRAHDLRWPRAAWLTSTVERARLLLPPGKHRALTPAERDVASGRFDALWAASKELVLLAPAIGDALCVQALGEAMKLGDSNRLLLSLGYEACLEASFGGAFLRRRARLLAAQVAELAAQSGEPFELAHARAVEGVVAFFGGEWAAAERALREARRLYARSTAPSAHERHVLDGFLLAALEAQGKLRELNGLCTELRLAVEQTGHVHAGATLVLAEASLPALARDQPLSAIARADATLSAFSPEELTPLHLQHFFATVSARLYAGHAAQAFAQVEQLWQRSTRNYFLRFESVAVMLRQLRARAALALAKHSAPPEADRLRKLALKQADAIGGSSLPQARGLEQTLRCGAALLAGRRDRARAHCDAAIDAFEIAGMALMRELARAARAELTIDAAQSKRDRERSRVYFESHAIQNPAALTRAWFPNVE